MSDGQIQQLLRRAVADNDATAMREAIELLMGGDEHVVSAEAEYALRHPDYVLEMPQSGERIRGRDAMLAMQQAFPAPPSISLRRVVGAGTTWVIEGVNDYRNGGDVWHVVVVLELDADGRMLRDTRYYTQPFEAPEWRAEWVETM